MTCHQCYELQVTARTPGGMTYESKQRENGLQEPLYEYGANEEKNAGGNGKESLQRRPYGDHDCACDSICYAQISYTNE